MIVWWRVLVKEGQRVTEGAELAYLESHDVTLAERLEIAALLEEARAHKTTTRDRGQASVRAAELRLKTIKQIEPLRIELQKAKVRIVEIACQKAEHEFQRADQLLSTSAVSREDHDGRLLEFQSQRELLKSARLSLCELEANFSLRVESAAVEIEEARATAEQALAAIPVQSLERKLALGERACSGPRFAHRSRDRS